MPPGLSFERKWEFLKPHIERLYVHDKYKLAKVIEILQAHFGFDATEAQYKYQIKKWRLRKNIHASKKAAMNQKYHHLSTTGTTAVIKYKGREVDPRILRRQAKMDTRRALLGGGAQATRSEDTAFLSPLTSSAAKLFMTWNLPYKPSRTLMSQIIDHHSPLGQSSMSTPSDVSVGTPHTNEVASPSNALSPLSSALRKKRSVERAQLFLEGKYQQLIASMSTEEQVTMSTWLYQFWLFSFKTAKYWGQGPRDWFADLLAFGRDGADMFPVPASPHTPSDRIGQSPQGQPSVASGLNNIGVGSKPSLLCRWAIHVKPQPYQSLPDPPLLEHRAMDPADPETYQPWPEQWMASSYSEKLRNALESNDFSNIPTDQLPAAIPEALKMAKRDPSELSADSLGFAIMSGNEFMAENLLDSDPDPDPEIAFREIDAFHLATSYLNGSKVCCNLLNTISRFRPLRQNYTNGQGHTVLDNLMIAILKGNTSCTPGQVDNAFKGQVRFSGEEVDICGRWMLIRTASESF
ncbi:hypothetical protein GJ744_006275 [Endocarpon pusillum]|uniref:Clr5 domain-containing protein n=1 Tax=Endocarpon pusillum TaxID=364733 RepID=A0A8H7AKB6_9EURO|nr:hypothetical protein GJ744_006275 [Endocarpon pusillum]